MALPTLLMGRNYSFDLEAYDLYSMCFEGDYPIEVRLDHFPLMSLLRTYLYYNQTFHKKRYQGQ